MNRFVLMPGLYGGNGLKIGDPFVRTFLALPPEATAFYCEADFARQNRPLFTRLMDQKRDIQIGTLKGLGPDCIVLSTHYNKFSPTELFARVKKTGAKILFYLDYTEETGYSPAKDEFFIYTSEAQLFFSMPNALFSLDAEGRPEAGIAGGGGGRCGRGPSAGGRYYDEPRRKPGNPAGKTNGGHGNRIERAPPGSSLQQSQP